MELATISAIASMAAAGVTAVGTIAAGNAAKAEGELKQRAYEFEAKQLDIHAKEEKAVGQREMLQLRRQKELALSGLTTRAAASGFTATDPTALALADEISRYGTLQEQLALYGGEARGEEMKLAAAGARFSGYQAAEAGRAKQKYGYLSAGGTILGGISSMAEKYDRRPRKAQNPTARYG